MAEPFDPGLESQILSEASAYQQAVQVADAEIDEVKAEEYAAMFTEYPWMSPAAAEALVTGGITASDDAARLAAGASFADGQMLGTIGGKPQPSLDSWTNTATDRAFTPGGATTPDDAAKTLTQKNFTKSPEGFGFDDVVNIGRGVVDPVGTALNPEQADAAIGSAMDAPGAALNNTVTRAIGSRIDDSRGSIGLGEGDFAFEQGLKPLVRGAMVVMDTPVQATHGYASALHDNIVEEGWIRGLTSQSHTQLGLQAAAQTDLGQGALMAVEGEAPDFGDGFFASEESGAGRRRQTERMRLQTVHGQPFTVGNLLASQVSEPGSRQYAIMEGLTNLSLEVAGPGAAFDHVFLAGKARRTIAPENAESFLTSNHGIQVMEGLTESKSFTFIDRALGRTADPAVVEAIRLSDDVDEVNALVRSQLGIEVTDAPKLPHFQPVRDVTRGQLPSISRWFGQVPDNVISTTDARQRVTTSRRYLETANASAGDIDYFTSRMAAASSPQEVRLATQEMLEVTALRAFNDHLGVKGGRVVDASDIPALLKDAPAEISAISRAWGRVVEEDRAWWIEETVKRDGSMGFEHMDFWEEGMPSPQAIAEMLSDSVPIPTYREVREVFGSPAFNAYRQAVSSGVHKGADFLLESAMSLWKTGRLLRLAWPVKVLGEGQLRLASFGYSSIVNNPVDYIAHAMSKRGDTDALGSFLGASDQMQDAMFVTSDVSRIGPAQQMIYADGFKDYTRVGPGATSPEAFAQFYADSFARLSSSSEFQLYLRSDTFDEAAQAFWDNMGETRRTIQGNRPSDARDIVNNRVDADDFLRKNVVERLESMTGGNPELVEAFRTRKLDGHPVIKNGQTRINPAFIRAVESRMDSLPTYISGRNTVQVGGRSSLGVVDRAFSGLMSTPSNKLDRSPLFRQQYWDSIERLASQLDPKHADELVANAEKALRTGNRAADIAVERRLRIISQKAKKTPPNPDRVLSLEEADLIAKSDGLASVRDVLYDASERNQFFDIHRHVFPFGDAFVEVMSRWIRILKENPNRIRKAEGVFTETEGIFSENQWGEETFNIPFSSTALSALGVENLSLRGFQSGLSIAAEMWPGYGPVLQLPAAAVIPEGPDHQWLRDHLSSGFGLPTDFMEDPGGAITETAVPPWARRALSAATASGLSDQDQRVFANLVGDIAMNKIANDPKWQIAMDDEMMNALLAESRREAQIAYAIRSIATFTVPGAPTFEMTTEVTGELLASWVVEAEYRRMIEELGPQEAASKFAELYGFDALAISSPASRDLTSGGGMPVHQAGVDWVSENGFAREAYPEVYGFFAPAPDPDVDDDFVYDAYTQRFTDGETQALSPRMRIELLQDYTARLRYAQERESVVAADGGSISQVGQEHMRMVRDFLEETYPGYRGVVGIGEKVDSEAQIAQLEEAIRDSRLSDSPLVPVLETYFERRALVNENSAGVGFQTGNADAYNRQHMYEVGSALASQDPQFAEVWERVLYPEFRSKHEEDLEGADS